MVIIGRLVLAVAVAVVPAWASPAGAEPRPRLPENVRVLDEQLAAVLVTTAEGSPMFAGMIETLGQSDLIVYIQRVPVLRSAGTTALGPAGGGFRYVRIRVRRGLSDGTLQRMLAHELQHAVEIAAAPEVIDEAALHALYLRIGYRRGTRAFDTHGAGLAELRVLTELSRAAADDGDDPR